MVTPEETDRKYCPNLSYRAIEVFRSSIRTAAVCTMASDGSAARVGDRQDQRAEHKPGGQGGPLGQAVLPPYLPHIRRSW